MRASSSRYGLGVGGDHQRCAGRLGDADGAQANRPAAGDQDAAALDRLDERGVDGVAHRLLQRDHGRIEPVRLDGVRLGDDDVLGEPTVDMDADHARVPAEVHVAALALGAGPVEEVRLDSDQVPLGDAADAAAGGDDGAGQLVAQDSRWL